MSTMTCPMCDENYDDDEHIPRILTKCWHTICNLCLLELMKESNEFTCPADEEVNLTRYILKLLQ